ncbi:MAG: hypothetical protein RMJ43_04435 [Chloroherpetonaceae bacterium]|nr:hypothetical protein [Chthonomonadaceae bacterium]MDW8207061.1 hypothetical protein [Chloroherpetonaceae bacterium]
MTQGIGTRNSIPAPGRAVEAPRPVADRVLPALAVEDRIIRQPVPDRVLANKPVERRVDATA